MQRLVGRGRGALHAHSQEHLVLLVYLGDCFSFRSNIIDHRCHKRDWIVNEVGHRRTEYTGVYSNKVDTRIARKALSVAITHTQLNRLVY